MPCAQRRRGIAQHPLVKRFCPVTLRRVKRQPPHPRKCLILENLVVVSQVLPQPRNENERAAPVAHHGGKIASAALKLQTDTTRLVCRTCHKKPPEHGTPEGLPVREQGNPVSRGACPAYTQQNCPHHLSSRPTPAPAGTIWRPRLGFAWRSRRTHKETSEYQPLQPPC